MALIATDDAGGEFLVALVDKLGLVAAAPTRDAEQILREHQSQLSSYCRL
jgi:hypothetical protein